MASTCMVVERRRPGKGGGGTWRRIGKAVVGTHAIIHGHGPAAPHHRDATPALAAGARASWNMGKSDVDGIFDPPYYEWFQFDKVILLSDLNTSLRCVTVRARVARVWEFHKDNQLAHVDIVFIDEQGNQMYGEIQAMHERYSEKTKRGNKRCNYTTATPRYKVRVIGADKTGEVEFVFFATVAEQIIGKRLEFVMRNAGPSIVPAEISALISQKLTFNYTVNERGLQYGQLCFQVNSVTTTHKKTNVFEFNKLSSGSSSTSTQESGENSKENNATQIDGSKENERNEMQTAAIVIESPELNATVSIVSQEPTLFNCPIEENIPYGLEGKASSADVENAAVSN
ncbi:hypothetical protein ZWY2020_049316 [Hordeum vulgare]|nr:hypothetical protein ZWY2020_049316 [Hordeum vulgare]